MPTAKKPVKRKTSSRAATSRPKPKVIKKASSTRSSSLKKKSMFSKNQLLAFVLIFAAIGGFFLYRSLAAPTAVASAQGESMTGGTGVSNVVVSGASGGMVRRIAANTRTYGHVTLPSSSTSLSVLARATSCEGWWPWVSVNVDGVTRLSATKVGTTSWVSIPATVNLSGGAHDFSVATTNDGVTASGCQRHVDLDVVTFYGSGGTTTPPPSPPPTTPPPTTPPPTTPPPTTPPPTTSPPPPISGNPGYTCTGPVNGLYIHGTGHGNTSRPVVINLAAGCTGSLSFDIQTDSRGDDCVKVQAGAHDLNIGPSSCYCPNIPTSNHQDGVQVQGGNNVVFHGLKIVCPYVNGQGAGAFYINGKDFPNINGVICDGCNLEHTHGGLTFNVGGSDAYVPKNSGARNSILHNPKAVNIYSGGSTMINQNNTIAPVCYTLAGC